PRHESHRSTLARLGFADPDTSVTRIERAGERVLTLLPGLARTADPDHALDRLVDLTGQLADSDALLDTLRSDEPAATRLLSLLGASDALGHHLVRHPEQAWELTEPALSN